MWSVGKGRAVLEVGFPSERIDGRFPGGTGMKLEPRHREEGEAAVSTG